MYMTIRKFFDNIFNVDTNVCNQKADCNINNVKEEIDTVIDEVVQDCVYKVELKRCEITYNNGNRGLPANNITFYATSFKTLKHSYDTFFNEYQFSPQLLKEWLSPVPFEYVTNWTTVKITRMSKDDYQKEITEYVYCIELDRGEYKDLGIIAAKTKFYSADINVINNSYYTFFACYTVPKLTTSFFSDIPYEYSCGYAIIKITRMSKPDYENYMAIINIK